MNQKWRSVGPTHRYKDGEIMQHVYDVALRKLGLMRIAQMPYSELEVEWSRDKPVRVDIRFKYGRRVAGHLDPYWPNRAPGQATNL